MLNTLQKTLDIVVMGWCGTRPQGVQWPPEVGAEAEAQQDTPAWPTVGPLASLFSANLSPTIQNSWRSKVS